VCERIRELREYIRCSYRSYWLSQFSVVLGIGGELQSPFYSSPKNPCIGVS